MTRPAQIDPRGPRFGAAATSVLLLAALVLGLVEGVAATIQERAAQPSFLLLTAIAALFVWGARAGVQHTPWAALFRTAIRPHLGAPGELEDPAAPTFAQGVGALVALIGVVLHLTGVPYGLVGAAAAAFVAAFLNAAFGFCLGCRIHVLLVRAGLIRTPAAG